MALIRITRPAFATVREALPPAGATAAASVVTLAAQPSGSEARSPRLSVVGGSYAAVIAATVTAFLLDARLAAPRALAEGASAFALFYVAAQAIERLLEPVSQFVLPTENTKEALDANIGKAATEPEATAAITAAIAAADKTVALARQRAERVVAFWALASMIGMVAAAVGGLYFLDQLLADPLPRWFDAAVTGIVIGGGTKALHDLITRAQKPASGEGS